MLCRLSRVLLLLVTWTAFTNSLPTPPPSTEQHVRASRQLNFGECCPCTGPRGRLDDAELDALPDSSAGAAVAVPSFGRGAGECPCCLRDADSAGAASGLVPSQMRASGPFVMSRPTDPKEEGKPLLHPEVGLASSVLETLREATDEEYQDALERDAARSAATDKQENNSEASRNIVTIILNPTTQSTEKIDDSDIAGTHLKEARCVSPLESTSSSQNLELPWYDPLGLSRDKRLPFDADLAASELRESVVDAPGQTLTPPLVKLLPEDTLHLDKGGVKDLKRIFKISKDMLDETHSESGKSAGNDGTSSKISDFGINTKISDLNDRIDQLNTLTKLSKTPKLKIDGKYSKVAKGDEVLEDSEENTNADSLQAPSNRELTLSPAGDAQRSNGPDLYKALNEDETKSVPKLLTTAKNLLKLKDVELIPSKVVETTAKASQSSMPNLKLLTIEEIISRAKDNLRGIIPSPTVAPTTLKPVTNANPVNDAAVFINDKDGSSNSAEISFDNSPQKFETEIIDAVPSSSQNTENIIQNGSEGTARASAGTSECKAVLGDDVPKESQPQMNDGAAILNQEFREANDKEGKQGQLSTEIDEGDETESSNKSLDVDRSAGLDFANKLERFSEKLKKSDLKSKSSDTTEQQIFRSDTDGTKLVAKDVEGAESRTLEEKVSPLKEATAATEDPKNDQHISPLHGLRSSENRKSALQYLNSFGRSRTTSEDLPTEPSSREQNVTAAQDDIMADRTLKDPDNMCNTNTAEKDANLQSSKKVKLPKMARASVPSDRNIFKSKPIKPNTFLRRPNLQGRSKTVKAEPEKLTDMSAAASEPIHAFNRGSLFRQTPTKPSIFRSEPNLHAPGPWTLWSGLELGPKNKVKPQFSPEKFRDVFEGLSRTRVNDGLTGPGFEASTFPETRLRLKSPFVNRNEPLRTPPLTRFAMDDLAQPLPTLDEIRFRAQDFINTQNLRDTGNLRDFTLDDVPPLPTLDEIRSRAQDLLNTPNLRDSGYPNLGNLRTSEPLKHLDELKESLQKNAANAVSNLQQTLSSTLDVAKVRSDNLLGNSLYAQPENVLDTLSKARFDVDDKLQSIHTNVMDRLSSINEQLSNMDPPSLTLPARPNLKSARMQEKSASENRIRITSPRTPNTASRSGQKTLKTKSQSRQSSPSTVKEPIKFPTLPKFDLSQLSSLPQNFNAQLGSRYNDKFLKSPTTKKPTKVEKSEQDREGKRLPIARKTIKKPAERTSTTSQRVMSPTSDLRIRPLQPTPKLGRTQLRTLSKSSPETNKWKMALATTAPPRRSFVSSRPLLQSTFDENERPDTSTKLSFDPKERLRASLKSQRDALGSPSHNVMSYTDSINERLKNSLDLHRQKVQENAKSKPTLLKPEIKVKISKMELPERTAFKEPPAAKLQKRDSETEEDEIEEQEQLLNVKPLAKAANVNQLLDKLRQSVKTTLSSAVLKPTLMDKEADKLQLKPDMTEGASDVFKTMLEKANEPMKENMTYQCKMVCNRE